MSAVRRKGVATIHLERFFPKIKATDTNDPANITGITRGNESEILVFGISARRSMKKIIASATASAALPIKLSGKTRSGIASQRISVTSGESSAVEIGESTENSRKSTAGKMGDCRRMVDTA